MSDVKKRKVPTPDLKAKIGLEAIRGLKTLNEIAQEYGVHPVQVGQYKKQILTQAGELFEGKRGPRFCRISDRRRGNQVSCGARTQDDSTCLTSKECVFRSTSSWSASDGMWPTR